MPRELAILACTECKRRNYTTTRNKRTQTNRFEITKYCPNERKRTVHKEVKSSGRLCDIFRGFRVVAQWQCGGLQNR